MPNLIVGTKYCSTTCSDAYEASLHPEEVDKDTSGGDGGVRNTCVGYNDEKSLEEQQDTLQLLESIPVHKVAKKNE